ncbi:hypothetical protein RI054_01g03080 [Pseudoscourfieldia marina]
MRAHMNRVVSSSSSSSSSSVKAVSVRPVTRRSLLAAVPMLAAAPAFAARPPKTNKDGAQYQMKETEGFKSSNLNGSVNKIWAHPNDWEDQYKQKTSYYEELLANTVANQSK